MQSLAPVITHPDCNVFHDDDGHKTDAAQRRAPDVFLDRRPSSSRATPTAPPRERLQHHSEADAVQRRATALLLDRRPSLSPTAARDSTVELGGPSLDCSHTKMSYCRPTVPNREGCTSPNSASSKVAFVTSASRMKPDRAPVLTAHARLLLPQDGELDAVQCCTTTALGRPIFDCLPAVCGSAAEVTLEEATARVICDSSASSTTTTGQAPSAGFTTPSGSINKVASAPSMFYNSNAAASYVSSRTGPSIVVHTPVLASVYATSEATNACTVPSVTSYCALKVFGKRPAKSYLQETDDTAPGQHNSIQKLRVSTNSWEQNLDEKPPVFDVYSDEKEECSSMFFDEPGSDTHGDGNASKNQQYLPVFDVYDDATEDSSNSCVHVSASTLEPLFSSEFVGVWTGTPKQQQFEEEQQYRHHILKNYSKPISSPARTTLGAVNLFSLDTAELIGESVKQNDSDTQILAKQLKASPGNMLMSGMTRNLWDPGVSAFLVTPLNTGSSNDTSGVSPAIHLDKHGITDSSLPDITLQVLKTLDSVELITYLQWDPGIKISSYMSPNATGATKLQFVDVYKFAIVHTQAGQSNARREKLVPSAIMRFDAFGMRWKKVNAATLSVPAATLHYNDESFEQNKKKPDAFMDKHVNWCRMEMKQDKITLLHPVHSSETPCQPVKFIAQPIDLKQNWAQWLLRLQCWYKDYFSLPQGTMLAKIKMASSSLVSVCYYALFSSPRAIPCWLPSFEMSKIQWHPGIENSSYLYICYSSMFSSTAVYRSTAATACMQLVLCSSKIAQEERDDAAVDHVSEIQFPMGTTSTIWDPGIDSLLFLYIWLHIHMIRGVNYCAIYAYELVSARWPLMKLTAQSYSNIEVDELTSRYPIIHLHQITSWTRTTSNAITSASYAYTMDLLMGQLEFICPQNVHVNYRTKQYSEKHLQKSEMDIIYITFLPP